MAEKYFELEPTELENFLKGLGFERTTQHREVVYVRRHHICPTLFVKIYTSISTENQVRERGSDAIRICSVFDNGEKSFGVGAFPRIYRKAGEHLTKEEKTSLLFDRIRVRLREAYARCNEWSKKNYFTRNG